MGAAFKQVLVLGGLVVGAFGVASLLNGRRKKRRGRQAAELEELPDELSDLQAVARPTGGEP